MSGNRTNILPDYRRGIQRLVYAVIVDAAKAARKGNDEARQWIRQEGVLWMDGAFDIWIPPQTIDTWIKRGCPLPRTLQYNAPERPEPEPFL